MSKKPKKKQKNGQEPKDIPERSSSFKTQAGKASDLESPIANASQGQQLLSKSTVFSSIEELTMDRFIACACDNNLKVLIKSGKPSDIELIMAWLTIKSQHLSNIADPQSQRQIEMTLEIIEFDWRRFEIETLLCLLEEGYKADVADKLQGYDYDYPFTEETYRDDIAKVRAEIGSEALGIDAMRIQLNKLPDDEDGTAQPLGAGVKQSFYNAILVLQKHMGLCAGITPMMAAKILTVFEFGTYLKEFNAMKRINNAPKQPADVSY